MMDLFKLLRKKESSKDVAKERLKLVLIHDRANFSPQFLDMVRNEIIEVIKKYMVIDEEALDIQLTKTDSEDGERLIPALVANIPIKSMRQGVR
jgi:cell division topological specificity factor